MIPEKKRGDHRRQGADYQIAGKGLYDTAEYIPNIPPEDGKNSRQSTDMNHGVEKQNRLRNSEHFLQKYKVPRTGNRQKLGYSLYGAQNYGGKYAHPKLPSYNTLYFTLSARRLALFVQKMNNFSFAGL
jgi:hypothetical protein